MLVFSLYSLLVALFLWKRFRVGVTIFMIVQILSTIGIAYPNPVCFALTSQEVNFLFSNAFLLISLLAVIWLDIVVFPVSIYSSGFDFKVHPALARMLTRRGRYPPDLLPLIN